MAVQVPLCCVCFFIFQKAEAAASLSWNAISFVLKREEFPSRGQYPTSALFSTTSWIAGIMFERYVLLSSSWIGKTIGDCTFLQREDVLFPIYWSNVQRAQKTPPAGARLWEQNKTKKRKMDILVTMERGKNKFLGRWKQAKHSKCFLLPLHSPLCSPQT